MLGSSCTTSNNNSGMLVYFFGDKLHWVSQSVLYLPKEEGGHGLIHLKSRIAAFRLQFFTKISV